MSPEELDARILNLVKIGRIVLVDDTKTAQRLQLQYPSPGGDGAPIQDPVPRLAEYGFSSSPPAGAEVVVVSPQGLRSHALAVATNHQPNRPTNLTSGDSILYSARGQKVWLAADGLHVDGGGGAVVVEAFSSCTIKGDLTVTGAITAAGDVTAMSGGAEVSLAGHLHPLDGGPKTGAPLPQ